MLTYHPAFDIYHTAFRIIRILEKNPEVKFEKDRLRIFDFILLFPHDLQYIQLPAGAGSYKHMFKESKYNALPNRQRVFIQLGKYFQSSISCLLSYEIIDLEEYKKDIITLLPGKKQSLSELIVMPIIPMEEEILKFLSTYFLRMNLTELKKRTGLIEYRYDIAEA